MLSKIKNSQHCAQYVADLKKIVDETDATELELLKKRSEKRKLKEVRQTGPGGLKKAKAKAQTNKASGHEEKTTFLANDDNVDEINDSLTMTRLKELLASKGKTIVGTSWPCLVKRLLDKLDEEKAESDDDD